MPAVLDTKELCKILVLVKRLSSSAAVAAVTSPLDELEHGVIWHDHVYWNNTKNYTN